MRMRLSQPSFAGLGLAWALAELGNNKFWTTKFGTKIISQQKFILKNCVQQKALVHNKFQVHNKMSVNTKLSKPNVTKLNTTQLNSKQL